MTGRRREGNKDGAGGAGEMGQGGGRGGKAEVNLFMFGPGRQAGQREPIWLHTMYKSTRSVKG